MAGVETYRERQESELEAIKVRNFVTLFRHHIL